MTKRHVVLLFLMLMICGATLARKKSPQPEELGAELSKAPATFDFLKNPFAGRADARAAGKKLYKRHCAECHGVDGRGQDKAPDLHLPIIQIASPGRLFWFLKNGNLKEGMPAWSGLPDQERWQLVTYLQTLTTSEQKPPDNSR
jgi:cytochrome c oxidase cbb3-type subunit 2